MYAICNLTASHSDMHRYSGGLELRKEAPAPATPRSYRCQSLTDIACASAGRRAQDASAVFGRAPAGPHLGSIGIPRAYLACAFDCFLPKRVTFVAIASTIDVLLWVRELPADVSHAALRNLLQSSLPCARLAALDEVGPELKGPQILRCIESSTLNIPTVVQAPA
jgi:hypothetical protein